MGTKTEKHETRGLVRFNNFYLGRYDMVYIKYLVVAITLICTPCFAQRAILPGAIRPSVVDLVGSEADDGRIITSVVSQDRAEIQAEIAKLSQDIANRELYLESIQEQIDAWYLRKNALEAILEPVIEVPVIIDEVVYP